MKWRLLPLLLFPICAWNADCETVCAKQLPLYYWKPAPSQGFINFGDALSVNIVE